MTARLRPDDPLAIIRQLAPALRKWIRDHVLGPDSDEAIQSGLTFTTGIFNKEPSLNIDAFQTLEEGSSWNFGRDDVTNADWATLPWPHNILVTVEEVEADCLQHIFAKALVTRAAGHRVVIAVASSYRQ